MTLKPLPFPKIYAIDWDGTIIEDKQYPKIGEPKPNCINVMKKILASGGHIIIWTCRGGREQEEGIRAKLNEHGIYDFIFNDHHPEVNEFFGGADSPKVLADVYIDDRNIYSREIDWFEIEQILFPETLDNNTK